MQLVDDSKYRERITELKRQRGHSQQLKTLRGKILDRKGRILACDEPQFQLHINYKLSCFMDSRVRRAKILRAAARSSSESAVDDMQKELDAKTALLEQVIEKCTYFGLERAEVENKIEKINNRIWNLRTYLAWKRHYPNFEDFEQAEPSANRRLELTARVDIAEMYKSQALLELETDDDIFAAQLEFLDIEGLSILPKAKRIYPYVSVGSQTIGWVGPATQEEDKKLFEGDDLLRYLEDEVCGREDGIEYVCESILRGKRGEVVYDIDSELVFQSESELGKDVSVTLDIELQEKIENYLAFYDFTDNCKNPAAVVIEVATGDILALVSMPVFDLSQVRNNYNKLLSDANEPLRNRAINKGQYPAGSVIKPVILVAGLESGEISSGEIIACPASPAGKGWPNCWLYNRNRGIGHDDLWYEQGGNTARNAIRGSCNIYFSRLADRIEPAVLQQWLFDFGYGQVYQLCPDTVAKSQYKRNLRQVAGQVSSSGKTGSISAGERRFFGIGQGNLRVTVLQVANAMAVLARNGLYKPPRLLNDEATESEFNSVALDISSGTLEVVRDGMRAVVNETGGTAYGQFAPAGFDEQGVKVYGKTGSTEAPEHAWFAGFAEDVKDRSIAIAVLVEGGEHGSSDAGPLARDIIQFCIEARYIGETQESAENQE
jgi:penicillin-binding protein 2